jgi:hypothetical protein
MENILDEIKKHKNFIKELNEKIKISSNINENNNIINEIILEQKLISLYEIYNNNKSNNIIKNHQMIIMIKKPNKKKIKIKIKKRIRN